MPDLPTIPEYITVHLGEPDSSAPNVTLPFVEYISNVASSEIYPLWNDNAIRANMYAQISFALNRIYTEFYRSRGYDFDITNSTVFDQSFVNGRNSFENIEQIAGEIFNSYIRRRGSVEPLFAAYCDGRRVTCDGLSQWGTVDLAEQGYTPYEILQYYYGENIDLVTDVPVGPLRESAPTVPLRVGSVNDNVRTVQLRLNRIGKNYPSIPKIPETDGIFGAQTEAAVRRFQEIFGLSADGVVGRATWYYIRRIYNAVKRLNEIDGEGVTLEEVTAQYPGVLREGDVSLGVLNLQYFINYLSAYYNTIPPLAVDGTFGPATRAAVIDVQNTFGLPADGIVGEVTWEAIYNAYLGIVSTIPLEFTEGQTVPFPGVVLRVGASGADVRLLQEYLAAISPVFPSIPPVTPDGIFGPRTRDAVIAFQEEFGLPINGRVGAITWAAIADVYEDIAGGASLAEGQYPGFVLGR